jgi:hypothetical protein
MTIAATGGPAAGMRPGGAASKPTESTSSDTAPFDKTLLGLLDQQLSQRGGDQRPFASGTMPPTVSAFNAFGFFAGSAPLGPLGDPAVMPNTVLASEAPELGDPPPPAGPPSASFPLLASEMPVTALPSPQIGSADPIRALAIRLASSLPPVSTSSPAAAGQPSEAPPSIRLALQSGPVATAQRAASPAEPPRAAATRSPDHTDGARMSVGMDIRGDGVAVSVVSDHWSEDDGDALHAAVARLLARHGLVLSELRVTRRGTADNLSQGGK